MFSNDQLIGLAVFVGIAIGIGLLLLRLERSLGQRGTADEPAPGAPSSPEADIPARVCSPRIVRRPGRPKRRHGR